MNVIKKYASRAITILMIAILVVGLFYAINEHIDGLGIFSIMAGIVFFSFLLYGHFRATNGGGGGGDTVMTNMSHFLKVVTSPIFIRMLPSLLTIIFSYLERHKDKLDRAAAQELQQDLQRIIDSFRLGFVKLENNIAEDPDHKPPFNNKPKM